MLLEDELVDEGEVAADDVSVVDVPDVEVPAVPATLLLEGLVVVSVDDVPVVPVEPGEVDP